MYGNRRFQSKRKCCEFFDIPYASVLRYAREHNVPIEKAIDYYISKKEQNTVTFKGKKWQSLAGCCEAYNLNVASVKTYRRRNKCSLTEAIEHSLKWKKDRQFIYHGIQYRSVSACCKSLGVSECSVRRYKKTNNVSYVRAVTFYLKKKENTFVFRGAAYKSIAACCRCYGLLPNTIASYVYRNKSTYTEEIEKALIRKNSVILYAGRRYGTLEMCCKSLGINSSSVRSRIYQLHCTLEESITHFIKTDTKTGIIFEGNYYKSVTACCKYYDISSSSVRNKARSTGCSIEDSIRYFIAKKKKRKKTMKPFWFRSVRYRSLAACCEQFGVNKSSVCSRASRCKCSLQESMEHFILFKDKIKECRAGFYFRNKHYKSIPECCGRYKISAASVKSRMYMKKCSLVDALEYFASRKHRNAYKNQKFCFHGRSYASLQDCCDSYDISKSSVVSRMKRKSCSSTEALEYYIALKNR